MIKKPKEVYAPAQEKIKMFSNNDKQYQKDNSKMKTEYYISLFEKKNKREPQKCVVL